MKYAKDQAAFFEDYAKAHVKLSELGEWLAIVHTSLLSYALCNIKLIYL